MSDPLYSYYEYKSGETAIASQRHSEEEVYHWMIFNPEGLYLSAGYGVQSESLAKSQALS